MMHKLSPKVLPLIPRVSSETLVKVELEMHQYNNIGDKLEDFLEQNGIVPKRGYQFVGPTLTVYFFNRKHAAQVLDFLEEKGAVIHTE